MPSRRDRTKADATRTPLADLATSVPERTSNADAAIPDDDMLPESSATMPAEPPETDTAPANVRSRPGARKISGRADAPAVPRTIAEMQAVTHHTTEVETDELAREERAAEEPEPPPLFITLRQLLVTTLVPFAILALPQPLLDLVWRGAGFSATLRAILNFIVIGVSGLVALMLFLRNWRTAFHDVPSELHPVAVLELWERRASGERRDGWVTGSLAMIGGFVLLLLLFLILTVVAQGLSAVYAIPFLLISLFTKAVAAVIFVGYLQRGLFALRSPTKATVITGLLYGIALALWNALTLAVSYTASQATDTAATHANPLTVIFTYMLVSLAVAFGAAWIRLRSGSLIAAVSFQLLLLLLGISV